MKRMSEVFTLPVYVDIYGLSNANAETLIDGYDADSEHLEHAAHAINNVDALADALEDLISSCRVSGNNILACTYAEEALNTYRGTK